MSESIISHQHRPIEPVRALTQTNWISPQPDQAHLGQEIAQIIMSNIDPDIMLSDIAAILAEAFTADGCLVLFNEKDRTTIQTAGGQSLAHKINMSEAEIFQLGQQIMAKILTGAECVEISDLQINNNGEFFLINQVNSRLRSILGIPTRLQGRVNGAIVLILGLSRDEYRGRSRRGKPVTTSRLTNWTELEKQRLKALASQVAIAISQVLQTKTIAAAQKQLNRYHQQQSLIHEITMGFHNAWELNQILQVALDGVTKILAIDRGLILLLKYANPGLTTVEIPKIKVKIICESESKHSKIIGKKTKQNQPNKSLVEKSFWLSECDLCLQAFTDTEKPVAIDNLDEFPSIKSNMRIAQVCEFPEMSGVILIPLLGSINPNSGQASVLGFFLAQQYQPRLWQTEEIDFIKMIATQLSIAIVNSQTQRHFATLVEERTEQLQRSLSVQSKLYDKIRQQVDQLRQLNQIKDEFLSTISHELRTPLTSMSLAIRMLRQPNLSPDKISRYLDILEKQCNQEINLVNDLLALQQMENHQVPIHLETIEIKGLIRDLAEIFAKKWADKGLSLELNLPDRNLKIQTDYDSLNRLLLELLNNAGKYSEIDTKVIVSVNQECQGKINNMVLSITNTGPEIPAAELPYIFDKFRRGQGVTQQAIAGTGLGLALVRCLVEHLNGSITVSSSPIPNSELSETCFTLTLPHSIDKSKITT